MIKDAVFMSKFEDGKEIASKCKVNAETKEIFDIEILRIDFFGDCYEETVFVDNVEHSVCDVDGLLFYK
jgi:hypothetical protein